MNNKKNIKCIIIGHKPPNLVNYHKDWNCERCGFKIGAKQFPPISPTKPPKIIIPIPLEWEQIDSYHQRSKTYGGWLFKTFEEVSHFSNDVQNQQGYDYRISVTFIPDPNHEWRIK